MNDVERMQGQLAALARRVEELESLARSQGAASLDEREAGRVAQLIGFPVEILILPKEINKRRALARALCKKGWGVERISRVLRCNSSTVWRWLHVQGGNEGSSASGSVS